MKQSFFLQPPLGAAHRAAARWRTTLGLGALSLTALLALGLSSPAAHAQSYAASTLYSFTGTGTDGAYPAAGLLAVNGILYGTTTEGGTDDAGTIFSVNASTKAQKTLYSFTGLGDGGFPQSNLIALNGLLYGTAPDFYTYNNQFGTVFSINPSSGAETTLYSFTGSGTDGANPFAGLINVNGLLYGTTYNGGPTGDGTVFSLSSSTKAKKTVYSFTDGTGDAARPTGDLVLVNGILYGTTPYGGDDGYGSIFAFDPVSGTETTIFSFDTIFGFFPDGFFPSVGLTHVNINGVDTLCGTTSGNNGTVFSINTDGSNFQTLYFFSGADGSDPEGALHDVYGTLYGTTYAGGDENAGTVFSLNLDTDVEKTLHSFTGFLTDGADPYANLIDGVNAKGQDVLYGTTSDGGTDDVGTVFSLTPTIVRPTAADDSFTVDFNRPLTMPVHNNDDAGGGSPLTTTLVTKPTHGTLKLNSDGSFTYTPTANYLGPDKFTYQVATPAGLSNVATVTLTVVPIPVVAQNDSYTIVYNTPRAVAAPGVLLNDIKGDNSTEFVNQLTSPTHGTVALFANGQFTYTPATGFVGTDSFTYRVFNSAGTSNIATVTLTVVPTKPTAVNHSKPVAHNTRLTINAPGVLGGDDNGGKGPLTASLVTTTAHGTLVLSSNGGFTYTPGTNYKGIDSFTYQAINSIGRSNIATVTLTVQ